MSAASERLFNYDSVPLSNTSTFIRLLRFHPAANYADDLRGYLYIVPVIEYRWIDASYSALSYSWGSDARSCSITMTDYACNSPAINGSPSTTNQCQNSELGEDSDTTELRHSVLPITESLDVCLRHLRSLGQLNSLPIWIDQICINQSNDSEKSDQIQLMTAIYTRAKQVLVWLGPSADDSDEVMDAWTEIGQMYNKTLGERAVNEETWEHISEVLNNPWLNVDQLFNNALDIYRQIYSPEKIGRWFSRKWFSRVWVIQEFCLCHNTFFVCGHKITHAEHVVSAQELGMYVHWFYNIKKLRPALPRIQRVMEDWASFWDRQREMGIRINCKTHLFEGKLAYMSRNSSEPATLAQHLIRLYVHRNAHLTTTYYLDRIYGLLGISSDAWELGIVPDYSSTACTAVLLTQIARSMILQGECSTPGAPYRTSLRILRYAQFPKICPEYNGGKGIELAPLPTWVPDWGNDLAESYVDDLWESNRYSPAGKFLEVEIISTSSPAVLGLRGFCGDTIEAVGDAQVRAYEKEVSDVKSMMAAVQMHLDLLSSVKKLWFISLNKSPIAYPSRFRHVESLWRAPVGNVMERPNNRDTWRQEVMQPRDIMEFIRFENLLRRMVRQSRACLKRANDSAATEALREAFRYVVFRSPYCCSLIRMKGKRPYVTEKGYLGMGPNHAQPGDRVVVFHGDDIAYVIRPVPEEGENKYILVGEAYCDGVMNGEMAETAEKKDFFLV